MGNAVFTVEFPGNSRAPRFDGCGDLGTWYRNNRKVMAKMSSLKDYSKEVIDHYENPRNVGEIEDPDGIGTVGNPACGDVMKLTIKVEDDRIVDARFKTFGCGAAIATSSMVTELVKGKTIREALQVSNQTVAKALGGLPQVKMHCSVLAEDALKAAILDYHKNQEKKG
jgi:nitrogen fixation NifU-like protein